MPVKRYKPTTPTRRFTSVSTFEEVTTDKPHKPLTKPLRKKGGRNNQGRVSMRRRGGGHKRRLRLIDWRRDKPGVPARIASIEYDPNRSARLALLVYADGEKRYIPLPQGLAVGDEVMAGTGLAPKPGNCMPLGEIPEGTFVHCVELKPGAGAQMVRGAGAAAQLMAKEGGRALLKLPSGEMRYVPEKCRATVGQVGNVDHGGRSLGKAGRSRWMGKRPKVRGVAMNPVDHPLGGGEGKSSGGRHPVSPWGQPSKGYRTRKKRKSSDKMIVKRRR